MFDAELATAIRHGIARTPAEPLLTDDVVAAHRLPISVSRMTAICQAAPADARVTQRGEWLLVLDPKRITRLTP
ncbi:MAG: hypothetical protein ACO3JG_14380 [Luteolibacter sp.]